MAISDACVLQWGLGENPGRNETRWDWIPVGEEASMGPGRKPRKEPTIKIDGDLSSFRLQWGLGENPGRNATPSCRGWRPPPRFNGAWAKTQEGTRDVLARVLEWGEASMGPGRKPRKEPRVRVLLQRLDVQGFNGAWAKTQEGTRQYGGDRRSDVRSFNGAWAKTQEGTGVTDWPIAR